jgi:tetratricopeptide (TPR) repeat protein
MRRLHRINKKGEAMAKTLMLFVIGLLLAAAPAYGTATTTPRDQVAQIVSQIRRADYEGDRPALKKSYDGLAPYLENKELSSRVRYWRGFALWRSAINWANDPAIDPKDLEKEFKQAVDEFKEAVVKDPGFVDAKVGMISCLGYIAYFHRQEKDRMPELLAPIFSLVKEAKEAAPDNPRLIWVLGPILWYTPAEKGGGLDKAIENYERGLEVFSKIKTPDDSLEPSWGKPELMMGLAYTYLQKNPPDVNAAERNARGALELVPYWHYLRDILLPQIVAAKTTTP